MTRYLTQPLSVDEEAWARWHLTDNLAMMRRCEEAVQTQRAFLAWAVEALPLDRLLWVMYDCTQALSWWVMGQTEEWLDIFEDILRRVPATVENRFDRHLYLRTAGEVLWRLDRPVDALTIAGRMRSLSEEAPDWERALDVQAEAYALQIAAYHALQDKEALYQVGTLAADILLRRSDPISGMSQLEKERLRVMCANVAWQLYRAQRYEFSIPLHRRAIALGTTSEHVYLWLAAALWATTKIRSEVLPLLRQGAILNRGNRFSHRWVQEFTDVYEDAEFLEAVRKPE